MTDNKTVDFKLTAVGSTAVEKFNSWAFSLDRVAKFVATPRTIAALSTSAWTKCNRSDGRVVYLTPVGIVQVIDEEPTHDASKETPEFCVPTAEWLIDVMDSGKVFPQCTHNWRYRENLYPYTAKAIAEKEAKRLVELQTLHDEMTGYGMEITDDNVDTIRAMKGFDFYYDYSDDHRYAIATRARHNELRAEAAKWPLLAASFAKEFK